jgi:hypothetical protein
LFWQDLESARKDKENKPNQSFLAQTIQKWRPVEVKSSKTELAIEKAVALSIWQGGPSLLKFKSLKLK